MSVAADTTHPFDAAVKAGRVPFKVKDMSLADFGRNGRSAWPSTRCRD